MANIYELLEQINSAIYGEDVRESIHDAIEQCYEDATGNPNSLSAIIEKLFNGSISKIGIGDYVSNELTTFSDVQSGVETDISSASVYLSPGAWIVESNFRVQNTTNDDGRFIFKDINDYNTGTDYITYYSIPAHQITYIRHFRIIDDDNALWQSLEPDGDYEGTALYPMSIFSGVDVEFVKVEVKAICLKKNSSYDYEESIEEQVVQNTADIIALKSKSFSVDANDYLTIG